VALPVADGGRSNRRVARGEKLRDRLVWRLGVGIPITHCFGVERLDRESRVGRDIVDAARLDARPFDAGVSFADTDEIRIACKRREVPPIESAILLELDGENGVERAGDSRPEFVRVRLESLDGLRDHVGPFDVPRSSISAWNRSFIAYRKARQSWGSSRSSSRIRWRVASSSSCPTSRAKLGGGGALEVVGNRSARAVDHQRDELDPLFVLEAGQRRIVLLDGLRGVFRERLDAGGEWGPPSASQRSTSASASVRGSSPAGCRFRTRTFRGPYSAASVAYSAAIAASTSVLGPGAGRSMHDPSRGGDAGPSVGTSPSMTEFLFKLRHQRGDGASRQRRDDASHPPVRPDRTCDRFAVGIAAAIPIVVRRSGSARIRSDNHYSEYRVPSRMDDIFVARVMSTSVRTVAPDTLVEDAANTMLDNGIRSVVVVDDENQLEDPDDHGLRANRRRAPAEGSNASLGAYEHGRRHGIGPG